MTAYPLKFYVVFLDGVGSGLDVNLTRVVDGVLKACEVNLTRVLMGLENPFCRIHFRVDATIVRDWDTYKGLIESSGNTTVVNVHNEILPVPSGYTEETWTHKIADFLTNRWGTWVHTGGQPFKVAHYQNGTETEWGQEGFQSFMSFMGKTGVTCMPPEPIDKTERYHAGRSQEFNQAVSNDWYDLGSFPEAEFGRSLRYSDFSTDFEMTLYHDPIDGIQYASGGVIRYTDKGYVAFGYYVHFGTSCFSDAVGNPLDDHTNQFGLGYVPTAAAIWCDIGKTASQIMREDMGSVKEEIRFALAGGRTEGLEDAFVLYNRANEEYSSGHYRQAMSLSYQATLAAKNATKPSGIPVSMLALGTATVVPLAFLTFKMTKRKINPVIRLSFFTLA
jgi:hypothetical protein